MAAVQSYKSKVLNLYSQDELAQFKIVPGGNKAQFEYKQGLAEKFVDFHKLSVQDVDVHAKMFQNAQAVVDENARARGIESGLQSGLDGEIKRAGDAEQAIQDALDAEKARLAAQETLESQALAQETAARQAKDILIDASIAQEKLDRESADSVHTASIVAEQTRAQGEEKKIDDKFEAYKASNDARATLDEQEFVSYKTNNDSKLDDHIDNFNDQKLKQVADNLQEKARAEAAEQGLQSQITNILSNTDPTALDSLSEIVSKFNAEGVTYQNRLSSLEAVVQALVEQLQ